MEFKVTTEFEGRTVSGEISGKGVQFETLLTQEYSNYISLNILEDLIEDLQAVVNKIKENHTDGFKAENKESDERTTSDSPKDEFKEMLDTLSKSPLRIFDIGLEGKSYDEQQFIKQLLGTFKDAVRVK